MSLGDTGNFGDVFWIGVKGNQKLKSYVKELRDALAAAGIPCDKGKFIPHITLVRKFSSRSALKLPVPKGEMTVKKASLMKSEFKNGKTMYVEL